MVHMNKITSMTAVSGLVLAVALAGVPAIAQTASPTTPQAAPSRGMMMHGMSNDQAGMPMHPEMMQKMSKMMDNCNGMMDSMMNRNGGPGAPSAPANKG